MGTQVLLVDNDAARSNRRRSDLASAGVEVITAFEEQQAAEAMKSDRVDIICIDSQFVTIRGPEIGALIELRTATTPVVLIVDEAQIPGQLQEHVDIIVDREDFPKMGKRLMQQLGRGQVPFFQRWFCAWVNRTSQSRHGESIPRVEEFAQGAQLTHTNKGENAMLTILIIILVLALVGVLPTWPYSRVGAITRAEVSVSSC